MRQVKDIFCRYDSLKEKPSFPYIIAEAGVNHEGDINIAERLINEAAEAGANAIKFQTYKAETLASVNSPAYWDTTKEKTSSQFELFKKYDRFWKKEYEELKKKCDKAGIDFLSTPFDVESADFLNELMPVFKISSSDITNKPFIEYIAGFNKPIILSTGASYLYEIEHAVQWIESKKVPYALLHCVLNYPTTDDKANLGMIAGLKHKFPGIPVGYSDHTMPQDMKIMEVAFLLGAVILEKHFTHDKTLPGNDHYHAMDKNDLMKFVQKINDDITIIGNYNKSSLSSEEISRKNARRSIVAKRKIKKGEKLYVESLTFKRPAFGISPAYIDQVTNMHARHDIHQDDIINWSDLMV
jgi:N-acetylneuraminate synthase